MKLLEKLRAAVIEAPVREALAAARTPRPGDPAPHATATRRETTPVPSLLSQTEWPCGLYSFPRTSLANTRYFNPSLCEWLGQTHLVTRRCFHGSKPDRNDITLWQLDTSLTRPLADSERAITFPNPHPTDNWEDPRTFVAADTLYLGYATFRAPWQEHYVHQGLATIDSDYHVTSSLHIAYGNNRSSPLANIGHEKNWLWFHHDDALHFIYKTAPHAVCRLAGDRIVRQHHSRSFAWRYGSPRGGTPPVLHDGLYWSFFHSSIDISPVHPKRRYYMGAYAFAPTPPFAPRFYTPEPLLTGSEADARQPKAPFCVFPCGALLRSNAWHISFGINDESCGWITIPHSALTSLLSPL